MDYAKFLGKYVKPEDIVFDNKPYGLVGKVLENSDILHYHKDNTEPSFSEWCDAINRNYFEPIMADWEKENKNWKDDFWLQLSDAYLWNAEGEKDILNEKSLPFPIFCASVYDEKDNSQSYPYENTALYTGIPMDPRSLDADAKFGGGYVMVSRNRLVSSYNRRSNNF